MLTLTLAPPRLQLAGGLAHFPGGRMPAARVTLHRSQVAAVEQGCSDGNHELDALAGSGVTVA